MRERGSAAVAEALGTHGPAPRANCVPKRVPNSADLTSRTPTVRHAIRLYQAKQTCNSNLLIRRSQVRILPGREKTLEITRRRDPLAQSLGHVFRVDLKHRSVWRAEYRLPEGRQVQRTIGRVWTERGRPPEGYLTKRTARAWLRDVLNQAEHGVLAGMVRTGRTFADAADEHLRYLADDRQRKPSTVRDARSGRRKQLLPPFGSRHLEDITEWAPTGRCRTAPGAVVRLRARPAPSPIPFAVGAGCLNATAGRGPVVPPAPLSRLVRRGVGSVVPGGARFAIRARCFSGAAREGGRRARFTSRGGRHR
jgi:hypothetical protein